MQRQQNILEQLCDKIVDFMGETFTKKYYLVKISQSKKGHVYFVVRKKEGDCLVTNCLHFIARFMKFPGAYFFGLVVSLILLINISFFFFFFNFKVIKECSNYHFLVVSMSTNTSEEILFCPYPFDVYLGLPFYDRQRFPLFISFRVFIAGKTILSSLAVKSLLQRTTKDKYHV